MSDENTQVSWMTLGSGTPVLSRDGEELGAVGDVIADRQKDIFSGITLRGGLLSKDSFVPADKIETMTEEAVRLTISASEAEQLEHYEG